MPASRAASISRHCRRGAARHSRTRASSASRWSIAIPIARRGSHGPAKGSEATPSSQDRAPSAPAAGRCCRDRRCRGSAAELAARRCAPSARRSPRHGRPGSRGPCAKISPMASSATAAAFEPGAFRTGMPGRCRRRRRCCPCRRRASPRPSTAARRRGAPPSPAEARRRRSRHRGVRATIAPGSSRQRTTSQPVAARRAGTLPWRPKAGEVERIGRHASASAIRPCLTRRAAIFLSCSGSGRSAGWRLAPTEGSIR